MKMERFGLFKTDRGKSGIFIRKDRNKIEVRFSRGKKKKKEAKQKHQTNDLSQSQTDVLLKS